jgi:hypothetical protein
MAINSGDVSDGGKYTVLYTPSATAQQLNTIETVGGTDGACRVCKALVVATGSTNLTVYDSANNNPTTASAIPVAIIPSTATVGQVIEIQFPCLYGAYALGATTAPKVVFTIDD